MDNARSFYFQLVATLNLSTVTFTPRSDIVDGIANGQNLFVPAGSPVDTLTGADVLRGRASTSAESILGSDRFGIYLQADLTTGPDDAPSLLTLFAGYDDDVILGEAFNTQPTNDVIAVVHGISLGAVLNGPVVRLRTGVGNDTVKGVAVFEAAGQPSSTNVFGIALAFGAVIDTGRGSDQVIGEASGNGNLVIAGIAQLFGGSIATGAGRDEVTGIAVNTASTGTTVGISGVTIDTGSEADVVTGRATIAGQRANGFGSNVTVELGSGNDRLVGFGDLTANGGSGFDTWDLRGYRLSEFQITKTAPNTTRAATFQGPGAATATIQGFEVFLFDNGIFTYETLPNT